MSSRSQPAEKSADSRPINGAPFRILIVEDDFLIAMVAEDALRGAGYDVVGTAASYEEALKLAEARKPNLVLMDILLATKRDGVDAAIEIRRRFGVRSLFTSANQDAQNMARAAPAEPVGWLPKPYAVDRLLATLERSLPLLAPER
jgi:two-component system, response regulator PdtaR